VAAILQAPHQPSGTAVLSVVSLGLLLRALAAALLAGMTDFRLALVAGVGIGILEQAMAYFIGGRGITDLAIDRRCPSGWPVSPCSAAAAPWGGRC
jgi:branched-subunit amino acid ABC-type transport system permease component